MQMITITHHMKVCNNMDVCVTCGKNKKNTKSKICISCSLRDKHKRGIYLKAKINKEDTTRLCSFCNKEHPWIYGQSNDFWLMRNSSGNKYECRVHRKHIYTVNMKNTKKKLRKRVSNLIRDCLAKHNSYKNGTHVKYVSWTLDEFKAHLESKFQPGMSWDNYGRGGWHIDHIVPDSWFNYDSPQHEDFKKCWSLDNLQPMWESDNCSKGNRFIK